MSLIRIFRLNRCQNLPDHREQTFWVHFDVVDDLFQDTVLSFLFVPQISNRPGQRTSLLIDAPENVFLGRFGRDAELGVSLKRDQQGNLLGSQN